MSQCRDSLGVFNESIFSLWTCSLCYIYIFPKNDLKFNYNQTHPRLFGKDRRFITTDIEDRESEARVCAGLEPNDCTLWRRCCEAADTCCRRQLEQQEESSNYTAGQMCPATWDGWSCFDTTTAGYTTTRECPGYIKLASPYGRLIKRCTDNGTWALHQTTGKEWTDYGDCITMKGIKGVVYAGVVANSISLGLLVPAVGIFLGFRQLRTQYRVMLHVCLLLSFVLACLLQICWTFLVYDDRIRNPNHRTFMYRHEDACKTLYMLTRYARGTNFLWMFCEGVFLYRLLIQAFKCPRSIRQYIIAGWGLPVLPICLYAGLRSKFANDNCWIQNAGAFEWILYAPNLICIADIKFHCYGLLFPFEYLSSVEGNVMFLLSILKILLHQLQQHPNEPSNYRRALKATGVLVPLFGLQQVFIMYRPSDQGIRDLYEVVARLVIDSQGGVVALVFCYLNSEVHSCVKSAFGKLRLKKRNNIPMYYTSYTVVTQKGNDIPEGVKDDAQAANCVS